MTKRFFFTAMGILILATAYSLGARLAAADVDTGGPGPRAIATHTGTVVTWDAAGFCWAATPPTWTRSPGLDLPVPTGDVVMVDGEHSNRILLVTGSGDAWMWEGEWQRMDPYPASPVAHEAQSFGRVKNMFRR